MARQVLPIFGAIVGAYFGNPQLGYAIGSIIGNAVDPQVIKGPALGEGQTNTAREGGWRPIVLGRGCVGSNIINVGPEIIRTHRDRQSKGGGPVSETKRRYRTFAMRICEGPVDLLRIWQGEKLVYDVRPESVIPAESAKYAEGFTFYRGDETQLPDPDLEAYMGVGNVNAYRGTSHIVFKHFDLTDSQGAIPNMRFEVASSVTTTDLPRVVIATIDSDNNGIVLVSPDGDDFVESIDTGIGANITSIHSAGNAIFVFAGVSSGRVSLDGLRTWTNIVGINPGGVQVEDVAYDTFSNKWAFVYGAGSVISVSEDGVNLANVSVAAKSRYCIAAKDGTFVAGGTNRGITTISPTGAVGEHALPDSGLPGSGTTSINSVVSSSNGFVASLIGQEDLYTSASGSSGSWSTVEHNLASPEANSPVILGVWDDTIVARCVTKTSHSFNGGGLFAAGDDTLQATSQKRIPANSIAFFAPGDLSFGPTIARSSNAQTWTNSTYEGGSVIAAAIDNIPLPISSGNPIPLSSIVTFVHTRCGHTSDQYDVSELTDEVDGIVFADSYNGSDAIRTILPIYFADASEYDAGSGYKINYIKRGKPVVRTITIDDLVDEPEEAVRQDSLERPAKLHVHFQNPTIGYAAAKATSGRTSPDVLVTGEVSIQVPITFSDVDEVWKVANKLHKVSWVEVGGTQELVVADNNIDLAPADCIGLSLRGIVTRYRIVSQEYVDGTLKCEMLADRQSAYTSNVTGIPLPEPEPPPPSIVGPTVSVFGDWPALADNHDALISYAAATGQTQAWWGAVFQRSLDDGANYATAATFDSFNTIMGVLQADLPAASPHYTDTTNVLRVSLYTDDTIDALTQQQFLSEGGAFALSWGDGGVRRWEVGQYRDAEQDPGGDWLLTTLLRGRLNTEAAEHLSGAIFVLLDNSLKVMGMQSAWLGMDLTHRAVSNGESPDDAVPYTDEFTGESQREWPVANLFGEINGVDLDLSCVPRHRFGTDDAPVQSINHDGYRWTATDGVNNATADTTTTAHTFDVTGWSTPITVTVAQLNRITGAGPTVSEDIA